jgi:hypothetical protein
VPSIEDAFNEITNINANLAQLHTDVAGLATTVADIGNHVQAMAFEDRQIARVQQYGFAVNSQNLTALIERLDLLGAVATHLVAQQESLLCPSEKISRNTCELYSAAYEQGRIASDSLASLRRAESILAYAFPAASVAETKQRELESRLEECCPTEKPEPRCQYERCPDPGRAPSFNPASAAELFRPDRDIE